MKSEHVSRLLRQAADAIDAGTCVLTNAQANAIIDVLRSQMQNGNVDAIVAKMVGNLKDADTLADELEDMAEYPDYLSEREAMDVVSHFVSQDGSHGAHWREPQALWSVAESYGVKPELSGHYNDWTFYAVMNMVWSDEWNVLRKYISQEDEAKVCAELAEARLCDKDENFTVRWYFGLD